MARGGTRAGVCPHLAFRSDRGFCPHLVNRLVKEEENRSAVRAQNPRFARRRNPIFLELVVQNHEGAQTRRGYAREGRDRLNGATLDPSLAKVWRAGSHALIRSTGLD